MHHVPAHGLIGGVACEACWERAIRADERVVALFGLEADVPPDHDFVDEIAVERALAGEQVSLTPVEAQEVARRKSQQDKQQLVSNGIKTGRLVLNHRNDRNWLHYAWPIRQLLSEAVA